MLSQPVTGFINHVLGQEAWARQRLQSFAGKRLHARAGFADFHFLIDDAGLLQAEKPGDQAADLEMNVPAGAWFGLMQRDESASRAIQVSGDTELAEAIQFLFLNVRWNVEEDLSRVVGDIAAYRIVSGGRAFMDWQRDAVQRLGENLSEYWREESRVLVARSEAAQFINQVAELRDAVERLEKRIEALNKNRPSTPLL